MVKTRLLGWIFLASVLGASPAQADVGAVRIRPVGLMSSTYGAEAELYGDSRISFGPTVQYLRLFDSARATFTEGWELGLRGTMLVGPFGTGRTAWYVGGAVNYYGLRISAQGPNGGQGFRQLSTWGVEGTAGRQWEFHFLGETWNARLGVGVGYIIANRRAVTIDGVNRNLGVAAHADPILECTLAYQF